MNCAVCTHELIGLHHKARYCSSLCRRTARPRRSRRGRTRGRRNPEYMRRKWARKTWRRWCKRYRNDGAFRKKVKHRHACEHYARKLGFASYSVMSRQQRAIRVVLRKQALAIEKRDRMERRRMERRRRTPSAEERALCTREYRREYNSKPANRKRRNERARQRRHTARIVADALREIDWLDERCEFKVGLWAWAWLVRPQSREARKNENLKKRLAIVHVARELNLLPQDAW